MIYYDIKLDVISSNIIFSKFIRVFLWMYCFNELIKLFYLKKKEAPTKSTTIKYFDNYEDLSNTNDRHLFECISACIILGRRKINEEGLILKARTSRRWEIHNMARHQIKGDFVN